VVVAWLFERRIAHPAGDPTPLVDAFITLAFAVPALVIFSVTRYWLASITCTIVGLIATIMALPSLVSDPSGGGDGQAGLAHFAPAFGLIIGIPIGLLVEAIGYMITHEPKAAVRRREGE
jgi:hypothetical protein